MSKTVTWPMAALVSALLAACAIEDSPTPGVPAPLVQDPEQPALALLEQVLKGHFASAGAAAPTTCATLAPTPLSDEQEEALILRLVRLAPGPRCVERDGALVDSVTGEPAQRVQVSGFSCAGTTVCRAVVERPGRAAAPAVLRFDRGEWRLAFDESPGE